MHCVALGTSTGRVLHAPQPTALIAYKHVECRDGSVCGWREPPLRHFVGEPICSVETNGTYPADGATLTGALYRVTTCELQYGPMNCDFVWGATNE